MRTITVAVVTLMAGLLLACRPAHKPEWQPTEQGFGDDTLAAAGWRIATPDEVRHLLTRWLPEAEGQERTDAEGYARAVDLLAQMGYRHFNPASGSYNIYGMLAADDGSPPVATVWYRAENGERQYGWFVDRYVHVDRHYQDAVVGVFMVRAAAGPE